MLTRVLCDCRVTSSAITTFARWNCCKTAARSSSVERPAPSPSGILPPSVQIYHLLIINYLMLRFKRSTEVPQIDRRQRDYVLLFNIYSISSLSWLLKRLFFCFFMFFITFLSPSIVQLHLSTSNKVYDDDAVFCRHSYHSTSLARCRPVFEWLTVPISR